MFGWVKWVYPNVSETKILYKMPVGGIYDQASVDTVALPSVTWNSWHSAHPFIFR